MNSIVSLISGQFTRSLIFGAFFPVILFLLCASYLVGSLLPENLRYIAQLRPGKSEDSFLWFLATAVIITVLLYLINTPIVRMFEGYPWQLTRTGIKRRSRHQAEHATLEALLPRLRFLRNEWNGIDPSHPNVEAIQKQINRLNQLLNFAFPSKRALVLPTRFGNVLRSFETYSLKQYGIDSILFWPRIISVVDKDTLSAVEEARSSVDFFVNGCLLSGTLAALIFIVGCLEINGNTPWPTLVVWPVELGAAAVCTGVFYHGAVDGLSAWGAQVRSVFDLFRFDLLKKMGFQQIPQSRAEERELWTIISKQVAYGDSPVNPVPRYAEQDPQRTSINTEPEVQFILTSGVTRECSRTWKYTYRVTNGDRNQEATAKLTERLPVGWAYVWGSATTSSGSCLVTGTNPHTFELGKILPSSSVDLTFSIIRGV